MHFLNSLFVFFPQMNSIDDSVILDMEGLGESAGEAGQKPIWNFHCFLWRGLFFSLPIGELERLQVAIWPPASASAQEETESQEKD